MKPKLQNSIPTVPGCFFVSPRWGKYKKTRFEQNYTTFVNPALCAAWKSPPKMVVWNRNCKIRFPGCFFVSPRWGKSKKPVLNKIIRPSSTRLYALLGKAHPKWWYETKVAKFDIHSPIVSFAAVFSVVTQLSSPQTAAHIRTTFLSSVSTNHHSGYIFREPCAPKKSNQSFCLFHLGVHSFQNSDPWRILWFCQEDISNF